MNTDEAVGTAVAEALEVFLATKDFAVEQAPEVIRQLLVWNFTLSLITMLLSLAIPVALFFFSKWLAKKLGESGAYGLNMFSILTIILWAECQPIAWIQIWLAPKIWLMEYAAKLVG